MTNEKNSSSRSRGQRIRTVSLSVRRLSSLDILGGWLRLRTDTSLVLLPLKGPGLPPSDPSADTRATDSEPRVHVGFLLAYDSVAQTVLDKLESQLRAHPSYTIIVCGKVKPYCYVMVN